MNSPRRVVIIGGVAGGATAASRLRRCCPEAEIEIYDQDEFISYAGCGLPYFIGGYSPNWRKLLARVPDEFESKQNIRVFLRHRVNSIDPEKKTVLVADLEGVSEFHREYDVLIIATGASPVIPPLEGLDLQGIFPLRTLTHALEIKAFIDRHAPQRVVVMGAGAIGLEMCEAFHKLGMEVHLVDVAERVLPPVDPDISSRVASHLEGHGVKLHLGTKVEGFLGTRGHVSAVSTSVGDIAAELVLVSVGIRPASDLARRAGLELGARDAIRVDEGMRTSHPDILACGDCATTRHLVTGEETWIPLGSTARKQGRVAAETAAGNRASFPGVQGTFILKVMDLAVGKTGLSLQEARQAGLEAEEMALEDSSLPGYYRGGGRMYLKVVVDKGRGRVLGAQVVGDYEAQVDKRLDIMATAVRAGLTASDLSSLDLAYAPPFSHPLDLPVVAGNLVEARILGRACSCNPEGLED